MPNWFGPVVFVAFSLLGIGLFVLLWLDSHHKLGSRRLCADCGKRMAIYENIETGTLRCVFCADVYEQAHPKPGQTFDAPPDDPGRMAFKAAVQARYESGSY